MYGHHCRHTCTQAHHAAHKVCVCVYTYYALFCMYARPIVRITMHTSNINNIVLHTQQPSTATRSAVVSQHVGSYLYVYVVLQRVRCKSAIRVVSRVVTTRQVRVVRRAERLPPGAIVCLKFHDIFIITICSTVYYWKLHLTRKWLLAGWSYPNRKTDFSRAHFSV